MTDDERPVYVLTVRQPYAWAIIHSGKDVENRGRPAPGNIRLLIHAGVAYDHAAERTLHDLNRQPPENPVHGCLVGMVDIDADSGFDHLESPWAVPGMFHWRLRNPRAVTRTICLRGQQWLFRPPENWQEAFA